MDDDRVTITRWRDAKDDTPKHAAPVWTDRGVGVWPLIDKPEWRPVYELSDGTERMDPQPRWWCDPRAPGDDPLTTDDLRRALIASEAWGRTVNWLDTPGKQWHEDALARLRAALDALTRGGST